jgi:hypothetical protein
MAECDQLAADLHAASRKMQYDLDGRVYLQLIGAVEQAYCPQVPFKQVLGTTLAQFELNLFERVGYKIALGTVFGRRATYRKRMRKW